MATQIPTLSTIPSFGKRGTQVRDVFVTAQEAAQDHMSGTFGTDMLAIRIATNAASEEIEETGIAVAGGVAQVARDKVTVISAKEDSESARDVAVSAKNEIQSYVVPIEATYSPETIAAMIDMAETLNLTGA